MLDQLHFAHLSLFYYFTLICLKNTNVGKFWNLAMGPLINVSYYAWRVMYEDNQQRPVMWYEYWWLEIYRTENFFWRKISTRLIWLFASIITHMKQHIDQSVAMILISKLSEVKTDGSTSRQLMIKSKQLINRVV